MIATVLSAAPPAALAESPYEIATFSADVTPPLGHPLIAGLRPPARVVQDPLFAQGLVLVGADKPVVVVSVDWCELRNDAYDRWRDAIAEAAGTERARVMLSCVHQHDAPYADLEAQRLLDRHGLPGAMFDPQFHEQAVLKVAAAVRDALNRPRRITHLGLGQAKVERVASNRRIVYPDGRVTFGRYSQTRDPVIRGLDEGAIDPWLKTISFWDGEEPLAALHSYATHPMSYYGRGQVSSDFVGIARTRRQKDTPGVLQIYASGCAGDVTAGKYNEGDHDGRMALAERVHAAMAAAWNDTKRHPIQRVAFRHAVLKLPPETAGSLDPDLLQKLIADPSAPAAKRIDAALGLSWQKRVAAGRPIDVPALDFGQAQIVLLPAEAFVEYQIMAQRVRPDSFVMALGYGECGPGYIPTEQARREGFVREHGYCWVAAGCEEPIRAALKAVLKPEGESGRADPAAEREPREPAADVGLRAPPGFEVTLYAGDELAHDIFSLTLDAQGRVVVAGRNYVKVLHDTNGDGRADRATLFSSIPGSGAHGLYFDGNDLIATGDNAVMRLRDADGDGVADGPPEKLTALRHPEHGANGVIQGPDGWFYVICGNDAGVTTEHVTTASSPIRKPECGGVVRISPDGKHSEVVAHGFRNPYNIDFNAYGQLFTVDADGERDQYLPWYAPTRLFDIGQGRHHGWVLQGWQRSWNRPAGFFDSIERAAELGRGSPTGLVVYRHRAFPESYQGGLFSCCWTLGRVYHLPLKRDGSTWTSQPEIFLETTGEVGFAPVGAAVGPGGDMFVAIGGRGTRGSVFRVRYNGPRQEPDAAGLSGPLEQVLAAPQPLASWSRAVWVPLAKGLGAGPFERVALDASRRVEERIRAIEVLVELHGGVREAVAAQLTAADEPAVRARAAWALGTTYTSSARKRVNAGPAHPDQLLARLTHAAEPFVQRAAWEALALGRDRPADALQPANWQVLNAAGDPRVRAAAVRAAADRLQGPPAELTEGPAGQLAVQRIAFEIEGATGLRFPALVEALAATDNAALQLEAVRLMQLALGDMQIDAARPDVYAGYMPSAKAPAVQAPADSVAPLARLFPRGEAEVDRELARLLGMLNAGDSVLLESISTQWTDETTVEDDLHYLIVLSRLEGERGPGVTRPTAAALARLHPKMIAGQMYASRNWPQRVSEMFRELCRRDPALPDTLVADARFQLPVQSVFAAAMPEEQRQAAARKLLSFARAAGDDVRWTSQFVHLLTALPADEAAPALREGWEDFALQDDVAVALARYAQAEDRFRFVERLNSPQPEIAQSMARVLAAMPGRPTADELLAAIRALRYACAAPQYGESRTALVALLRAWSGAAIEVEEKKGADLAALYQPWFDWFEKAHPEAASQLAGLSSQAWQERLTAVDWDSGDAGQGKTVFEKRSCHKCHLGDSRLGPDLAGVAGRFSREDLLAAIVDPSKDVSPLYQTTQIATAGGKIYTGLVIYESPEGTLLQTSPERTVRIAGDEIVAMIKSRQSLMPTGLLDGITDAELADLFAYIKALAKPR